MEKSTITVVVPTLDEEASIGAAVESARQACDVEIVVADGGSRDRTVAIARSLGARVVAAPPGRGRQMNAGAALARGGILLFLHADTTLPPGWDGSVREALARPGVIAGAFRLRLEPRTPLLAWIEHAANVRSRLLGLPFGDQSIFLEASNFSTAGGYPEIPIMEDVALVRKLGAQGGIVIASGAVVSSSRRWLANGIARTTMVHQACLLAYFGGVSPERIARWRRSFTPDPDDARSSSAAHRPIPTRERC